jgi:hypothetical protein
MKAKRKKSGKITKHRNSVALCGSARVPKNSKEYKEAYKLAKMLGERDIDLVTGGGPGLMEAANRGHKEGSVYTHAQDIGLGIVLPKEQKFNDSLDIEETFMRFTTRLDNFMLLSNAVIVFPGGVGTMLELFYTWQLVQVNHVCHIPIILMGDHWSGLIDWLEDRPLRKKYFTKDDMNLLFVAKNSKEAIKVVDKAHEEFKKGGKDFCVNHGKYAHRMKKRK